MTVTLSEVKTFLRVETSDDDTLITNLITAAKERCRNICRMTSTEFEALTDEQSRMAVIYAIAWLYENREAADFNELNLSLRASLSGIRKGGDY